MCDCLVTGNIELSTAKYDKPQEVVNSTESGNYYSAIGNQHPCTKQANSSNVVYKVSA